MFGSNYTQNLINQRNFKANYYKWEDHMGN
jgi:hypothetical protein